MTIIDTKIIKNIIEGLNLLIDVNSIDDEKSLAEQGIDSLDLINIFFQLEEDFKIKIPEEDISKLTNLNQIVGYIKDKTSI